jgi:DNA-binding beta-propeller fold protein YncE
VDQSGQVYVFLQKQAVILHYNLPSQQLTRIELIQDRPHGFTIAPDGSLVVSSEENDKKLVWYDGRTGDVLRQLQGDFGTVNESIAIAQNGEIYLADFHGSQIWRLQSTGELIRTYTGGGRVAEPVSIAIGPDQSIWVLNARSGGLLHISPDDVVQAALPFDQANQDTVPGLVTNEDGSVFVAAPDKQRIELYSADGVLLDVWGGYRWPTSLSVGPDGRFYVIDNEVRELAIVAGVSGR